MTPALPTASSAYGLNGPSADATVDNATSAGLHLSPWQSCPNKRGQLFQLDTLFTLVIVICVEISYSQETELT